jgi:hypothetical protein
MRHLLIYHVGFHIRFSGLGGGGGFPRGTTTIFLILDQTASHAI